MQLAGGVLPDQLLLTIEVWATRILAAANATEWHRTMVNPPARIGIPPQRTVHFLSPSSGGASDRYAVRM
jgi:hypothetical protein